MASNRLPPTAYKPIAGEAYVPYVTEKGVAQATLKAIVTGAILGLLFGAANTYLGLKAGLTISTSIPVSVLTVVAFRALGAFGARHHILELNMSQTVGSASSSVASGVLFTIPALFLWGLDPAWMRITLLAMAGGLFGILAMIPLRRYLIRQEHGNLPYPEGMACAEVLVAAESGGKQASGVFFGLGLGMFVKWLISGLKLIPGKLSFSLPAKASVAVSVSPALMGVGYILGPRIASIMVGGSALAAFILIPGIYLWGNGLTEPLYPETQKLIADMSTHDLWHRYIRYIGAGAVATGGIITLIQSIPTMIQSFRIGMQKIGTAREEAVDSTDLDLGWRTIALIVAGILVVLTVTPGVLGEIDSVGVRGIASVLIAIFAFFFVTVSARIVGLVGQTSNPTSGMTIAALIGTSSIFWALGWTDTAGKATALMVGTAVCVAASIAGDTSQDLKTGFILGATPRLQQLGEMLGVVTSAGVVAYVVRMLHQGVPGGIGGAELPAPQSVLMKLVIDGVIDQNLPWTLIFIGMGIALVAAAFRLPVLAFAVGVYLPLSTMAAVFTGGALRWWLTRGVDEATAERRREQGTLVGAGLVGGEGLIGVGFAVWVVVRGGTPIQGLGIDWGPFEVVVAAIALIALIATFSLWTRRKAADEDL